MDCDRVRDLLSAYLKEELADGDRAGVAAHLDGCPRCAGEAAGLAETLALLSALPRESAPPELLGRVMKAIEGEAAGTGAPTRRPSFTRLGIPIEAAAAVFLIALVYGIQRGMPPRTVTPAGGGGTPPAADVRAPVAEATKPPPEAPRTARTTGKQRPPAADVERSARAVPERESPRAPVANSTRDAARAGYARVEIREAAPPPADAKVESREAAAPMERAAPGFTPAPFYSFASTARVSSPEEPVEPRVFAAPPSRIPRPLPYGREVTLEVTPADRDGIEAKIMAAAESVGGAVHPDATAPASRPVSGQPPAPAAVRVHLPAESAGAFLDALGKLGTIPPGGMPAASDLPAGPSPGVVAYTVRVRVR